MLASTPVDGGHYFIDLIAGVAVAVLAIIAARRICRAVTLWLPELICAHQISASGYDTGRMKLRYRRKIIRISKITNGAARPATNTAGCHFARRTISPPRAFSAV
jgi:hypothetical protein